MDKNSLAQYGWLVVCILVLAIMITLATPFGSVIRNAVTDVVADFDDKGTAALDGITFDADFSGGGTPSGPSGEEGGEDEGEDGGESGYLVSLALATNTSKLASVTLVSEAAGASLFSEGEASLMSEGASSYAMTYNSSTGKYEATIPEEAAGVYSVVAEADNHVPYTISSINVDGNKSFVVTLLGGDIDCDGIVDSYDLGQVVAYYNEYNSEVDITGDGYVDWQDLFVVLNNYNEPGSFEGTPPVAESGVVSFDLDFAECVTVDTADPAYKLTVSVNDSLGDIRLIKNTLKFDNTVVVPVDSWDASIPDYEGDEDACWYPVQTPEFQSGSAARPKYHKIDYYEYPTWNFNGANSSVDFVIHWSGDTSYVTTPDGFWVYEIYFKLADGKTIDDVTSETFGFDYIAYANSMAYYYGHSDASLNTITVNNNVGK